MSSARWQSVRSMYENQFSFYTLAMKNLKIKSFIVTSKIRYVGINLTKKVQDSYTENNNTLLKEIKEDLKQWRETSCSWIKKL